MEELLKALGYPASAVIVFVCLAYVWRQIFEKTLDVLIEDRKNELSRETERLKATLGIEAETYQLAAQERFKSLLSLWEHSEDLLQMPVLSNRENLRAALQRWEGAVKHLNRHSVLLPRSTVDAIKSYLEKVGTVLTNEEKNYDEHTVTTDKISTLLKELASPLSIVSPAASIAAEISAAAVPFVGKFVGQARQNAADEARTQLQELLRKEFGVWIVEEKLLAGGIRPS